jgi:hypothetical protein
VPIACIAHRAVARRSDRASAVAIGSILASAIVLCQLTTRARGQKSDESIPNDAYFHLTLADVHVRGDVVRVLADVDVGYAPKRDRPIYHAAYLFTCESLDGDAPGEWDVVGPLSVPNALVDDPQPAIDEPPTYPIRVHRESAFITTLAPDGSVQTWIDWVSGELFVFRLEQRGESWSWVRFAGTTYRIPRPTVSFIASHTGPYMLWREDDGAWKVVDQCTHSAVTDDWLTGRLTEIFGHQAPAPRHVHLTQDARFLIVATPIADDSSATPATPSDPTQEQPILVYDRAGGEPRVLRYVRQPPGGVSTPLDGYRRYLSIAGEVAVLDLVYRDDPAHEDRSIVEFTVGMPGTGEVRRWESLLPGPFWTLNGAVFDDDELVLWIEPTFKTHTGWANSFDTLRLMKWSWPDDERTHFDIDLGKLWLQKFEAATNAANEDAPSRNAPEP